MVAENRRVYVFRFGYSSPEEMVADVESRFERDGMPFEERKGWWMDLVERIRLTDGSPVGFIDARFKGNQTFLTDHGPVTVVAIRPNQDEIALEYCEAIARHITDEYFA